MAERIHIVVDEVDKERFRRLAAREGRTLSEWLREAAEEKAAARPAEVLDTVEALRAFFEECDRRAGSGPEPDWEEHERVILDSIRSGAAPT